MTQQTSSMEWTLIYKGGSLPIISGSFSVHETSVPGASGSVTVPYSAAALTALEPRKLRPPRVRLYGQRSFWTSMPVSAVSERFAGTTGVAVSALNLTGVSPGRAATPDAAAHDIVGDIDVAAHAALTDWSPSSQGTFIAKYITSGNQRSWRFYITTAGNLGFAWSANGTAALSAISTVSLSSRANGSALWVRATLDVNNGASGNTVTFYTSTDGESWTVFGDPVITASTTSIYSGTAAVTVGAYADGATDRLSGNVMQAWVKSGINGTMVTSADFRGLTPGATSFTDPYGFVWTITSPASIVSTTVSSPKTLQYMSNVMASDSVGDFSERFGSEMSQQTSDVETSPIDFSLHVRRVRRDYIRGTISVDLASDEALLMDWAVVNSNDNEAITDTYYGATVVKLGVHVKAVTAVATGRSLRSSSYDNQTVTLDTVDPDWRYGVTGWDLIKDALDEQNCKLRPLPDGRMTITHAENPVGENIHGDQFFLYVQDQHVLDLQIESSRTDDWYDSAVVSAENAAGTGYTRGSTPGGSHSRTYVEMREKGFKPNSSMTQNIVSRSKQRGLTASLTMPIVAPLWIRSPVYFDDLTGLSAYDEPWYVRTVTYDIIADRMSVDLVYDINYV